jgi:hypothetical protein
LTPDQAFWRGIDALETGDGTPERRVFMRKTLYLRGRFGFGGVGADVCNPVVDDCQEAVEAVEAVSGQFADRDFRSQTSQIRLPVEPRDAEGVQV